MSSTLTEQELNSINLTVRITGSIGLLSVLFLIGYIVRFHKLFRNPTGRLMICITFCDLIDSIFKVIGRAGVEAGIDSALCKTQAFMLQLFTITEAFLGLLIIGYSVAIVCYGKSINFFKKSEYYFIAGSFIFSLPFAIVLLVTNLYGDAELFCWIGTNDNQLYQLWIWTIPILFFLLVEGICVFSILNVSHRYGNTNVFGETTAYKSFIIKRCIAYQIFLWVTVLPSLLNRIITSIMGRSLYPLVLLNAIMSPLQGLFSLCTVLYVMSQNPIQNNDQENSYHELNVFNSIERIQGLFSRSGSRESIQTFHGVNGSENDNSIPNRSQTPVILQIK